MAGTSSPVPFFDESLDVRVVWKRPARLRNGEQSGARQARPSAAMATERTLRIIESDAAGRNLAAAIYACIESMGLAIIVGKRLRPTLAAPALHGGGPGYPPSPALNAVR